MKQIIIILMLWASAQLSIMALANYVVGGKTVHIDITLVK